MTTINLRIWHSTQTAADYAGCHPTTVRKACEDSSLHGSQRTTKGRWRIHIDCLNAWVSGQKCDHQR